jgi:signal transduction histidine kinase
MRFMHRRSRQTATADTLRKLKIALVSAILIPALSFGIIAWGERIRLLNTAENDSLTMAAVLREHALKVLDTDELLVRELDRLTQAMDWSKIHASSFSLSVETAALHSTMPQVSLMGLTDADGWQWVSSQKNGDGKPFFVATREYWLAQREADRGTFVSRPYVGERTGRTNFGISRRRTTPDGKFDGTVHVAVAVTYFTDFWAEAITRKDSSTVALIRTDGEMLARIPNPWESLPHLVPQTSTLMNRLASEPNSGVFRGVSPADNVERICSYAKVGNYPLVIFYGVSVASVLEPLWGHLMIGGAVAAVMTAALVLAILSSMWQVQCLGEEQARRARIEEAARVGQRLELLGQLAAGVAHDFANIIQAVSGTTTIIERVAADPERVSTLARRMRKTADRGAALTQRMLDLVRKEDHLDGSNQSEATDPGEALSSLENLLLHALGTNHRLRMEFDARGLPPAVRGSRVELEASLVNLAINARDATPDGGEIVIRAETQSIAAVVEAESGECRKSKPVPGLYVRFSVRDSGVGMTPEVLVRASEPFFTTKPRGQGTGLGLAGARGFAERSGGCLSIESCLGVGTTVTIWLPVISTHQEKQTPGAMAAETNVVPLHRVCDRTGPPEGQ